MKLSGTGTRHRSGKELRTRAVSIQDPTSDERFDGTHRAIGPATNRKELCRRRKRVAYGGRQMPAMTATGHYSYIM